MIPVRVARVVQGLRWLMALYVCGLRGGRGKGLWLQGLYSSRGVYLPVLCPVYVSRSVVRVQM